MIDCGIWTVIGMAMLVSCIVFQLGWMLYRRGLPSRTEWIIHKSTVDQLKDAVRHDVKSTQKGHEKRIAYLEGVVKKAERTERLETAWMSVCERLDAQGARIQELEAICRISYPKVPAENSLDMDEEA